MDNNSNIDKNFDVKKYLESVLPLIKHYVHINDYKNAFNLLLHIFSANIGRRPGPLKIKTT